MPSNPEIHHLKELKGISVAVPMSTLAFPVARYTSWTGDKGEANMEPNVGDYLYIGDDDDGNPAYVEVEPAIYPMFMGEVDGQPVWTE